VLWVPDFLYGLLARSAPDFLDWRSDTLHFPELEPNQFLALQSATWEGGLDTQMPAAARRGRVQELASRIKANENTDDPVIQDAVAGWLNELGLHFMLLGRWRDAKVCFERMLVFVRRLGNRHGEAAALNSLGNIFASLGDTKQAVESYNKSLGIAKEINHLPDIGAALGNLGTVYSDLGDYQRAVVFYSQSLEVARLSGDRRGESAAVGNLGIAFKNLGDFNRAIEFHTQHLELARKLGDRLGEGNALGGLGNAYAAKGDDGQALTFHRQQHEIAHKIGNMRGEGSSLFNEALSLDSLGRRSEAICQAKVALKIFEEIKDPNTARVRKQLADWQGAAAG
jgi:tetratricopeptide (TPR) repeat protein